MKTALPLCILLALSLWACQQKKLPKENTLQEPNKSAQSSQKRIAYPYKKVVQKLAHGVRFSVSGVDTSKQVYRDTVLYAALSEAFGRKIEGFSTQDANKKFYPIWANYNGFVISLHYAYKNHHPFTISPDMIWLLICQGFSNHINANPEKFRHTLVNHNGKKQIIVEANSFTKYAYNAWQDILPALGDSIRKYTKENIYETVVKKYSTTTPTETIAYQVSLLETIQPFFEYQVMTSCGLPYITLEGTPEDWRKIRQDVEQMKQYELTHWVNELTPILDEFVKASEGNLNELFWRDIYKLQAHYKISGTFVDGWITKFFPYLNDKKHYSNGNQSLKNYVPPTSLVGYLKPNLSLNLKDNSHQVADERLYPKNKSQPSTMISLGSFPKGISSFDFVWKYQKDGMATDFKMVFVAGFAGFEQDKQTKALRPVIQWAVYDKNAPNLPKQDKWD